MKRSQLSTLNSPLKNKGSLYEKSCAVTLWVVQLAKYLQGEKEGRLST